jgi:ADP-ribosylglycohydrolase
MIKKAQGCLAGLCVGDALGSQLEFMHPLAIDLLDDREISMMTGSNIFHSLPGQITDDGEMALCLVNSLLDNHYVYDQAMARKYYVEWIKSNPIDNGITTRNALLYDVISPTSESNGALMRVAPLGIALYNKKFGQIINASIADARITHDNNVVFDCNSLFTLTIAMLMTVQNLSGEQIVQRIKLLGEMSRLDLSILNDSERLPEDYYTCMGHVKIAFQNAFYHLRKETPFKEAIIQTIRNGGDTDTNAAICGALMGAFWGIDAIPHKWLETVMNCESDRPLKYKTNNILEIAKKLLTKKDD